MIQNLVSRRLIFVPTHRDCSRVMKQRLQEARWVHAQPGNSVTFCIIENELSDEISQQHKRLLLKERSAGLPIIHFIESQQHTFINSLLTHGALLRYDRDRLYRLLLPKGISYGRGPNLAYLLAVATNCVSVHRRDSDVLLDESRQESLPVELELAAIGRTLNSIELPIRRLGEIEYPKEAKVKIVGTGTFGDATLDRRDLQTAGISYLTALQQLGRPGIPAKEVEQEATSYLIKEAQTRYSEDFYELEIDGRVEMESCCIADLYRDLPEMPTDILGCDYMVKDLAWRLQQPILFHSRKMHHAYDNDRSAHANQTADQSYALRDVQYIQMGRIWSQVGEYIEQHLDEYTDGDEFNAHSYAAKFRSITAASRDVLRDVRLGAQRVYTAAAAASAGPVMDRLNCVADALEAAGAGLDEHVMQAVDDFAYLTEAWRHLITAAESRDVLIPPALNQ